MSKDPQSPEQLFVFVERCVSHPTYRIRARTLEEAAGIYARRVTGAGSPDQEEVSENWLATVYAGEDLLPGTAWEGLVTQAIDRINQAAREGRPSQ